VDQSRDLGVQLNTANLFLVRPDPEFADEQSDQPDERDSGFVGVVVRGPARDKRASGPSVGDSFRRVQADLEYLIADGPVIAAEISPMLDTSRAIELKAAHVSNLSELLVHVRNRLTHGEGAIANALAVPHPRWDVVRGEEFAEDNAVLPVALLDRLIETARAQLSLLTKIREAQTASAREQVTLQTATGPLQYTLPLSLDDTYSSTEVSEILSPTGKGHRTIAQNRRRANELLGVKIGSRYRYPKFQIDPIKHGIRPVVAYANRRLECDADPWGTLDWWFSEDEGLDGLRPIDLLERHELSDQVVDFAIERSRQGMD
jgi:hypothetical protein